MLETSGPCEDGGDWVSGGVIALLILSVVPGDGSVGSFRLECAILVDEHGSHEAQRAEALRHDVGLHVAVIVLASPYKSTITLDNLSYHIVNKSVLIIDSSLLIKSNKLILVNSLESVFEKTVVFLEDGVLGGEFQWISSVESVMQTRSGEGFNRFLGVEHSKVCAG